MGDREVWGFHQRAAVLSLIAVERYQRLKSRRKEPKLMLAAMQRNLAWLDRWLMRRGGADNSQ